MKLVPSHHFKTRCKQSNLNYKYVMSLIPENLPIRGQIRYRINHGFVILEQLNGDHVIIKTLIPNYKLSRYKMSRKGNYVY